LGRDNEEKPKRNAITKGEGLDAIFLVTAPFFGLVLMGYIAARAGMVPLSAIPGLNSFVLYFALPCMLFEFGAKTPFEKLVDPRVAAVYLATGLILVALAVGWAGRKGLSVKDGAFGAITAAFPNAGFIGVPLLVTLMGAEAAGPVILMIAIDMVIISSGCLALAESDHKGGAWTTLISSLKAIIRNPMPIAIVAGAVSSWLGIYLYGPVEKLVGLLSHAASPVALFTIGAVLWRSAVYAQRADFQHQPYLDVVALKLLVHPLLIWILGSALVSVGYGPDPTTLAVMVLCAALPSASNVSLLAERFGADNSRIARIILVTTVVSFVSFSVVAWLMGVEA
jgi:malonate transporter and related proteins